MALMTGILRPQCPLLPDFAALVPRQTRLNHATAAISERTMGISLSATPILPVVDLPKLIHKIIMLPPGTRSLGYLTLDIALLRSEIRTPLFVLSVPAVTATIVRLILIPLIRVPLILLWRIIRSLLRGRSGDTGDIWQRDRDPRLLLLRRRERTPQERRNCPSKNDTKLHVNLPRSSPHHLQGPIPQLNAFNDVPVRGLQIVLGQFLSRLMGWHIILVGKNARLSFYQPNIAHGLVVFVGARLAVFILRIIRLRYEQGFRNRPDPAATSHNQASCGGPRQRGQRLRHDACGHASWQFVPYA